MNTITITVPLTAENLMIISQLTGDSMEEIPAVETTAPIETPIEKAEVTKTEVRAAALVLAKAGRQEELKKIFKDFNAEKLSDIAKEDYPALLTRLNEVGANG